jgi:predicted O-methyltransferase YrrM
MKKDKTLNYILEKYQLNINDKSPLVIQMSRARGFVSLLDELGFKTGVEIGTKSGRFAERLCAGIKSLKLATVDPWLSYGWYQTQKSWSQEKMDQYHRMAIKKLKKYHCQIIKGKSEDFVNTVKDQSFDFVYIDGNHEYRHVLQDLALWCPKIRPGGIVSGHDFYDDIDEPRRCQVKKAVLEYVRKNRVNPWFVLKGDPSLSWFWVKE